MYRHSHTLSVVLISALLGACATPAKGPLYADYQLQHPSSQDNAKLTVFRQHFDSTAKARSARIKLDSQRVGGVDLDGFISIQTQAGKHTLSADLPEHPGACVLDLEILPNQEYFFEVAIRGDAVAPALLFGALGAAIESSGKSCGGLFAIRQVEKEYADSILKVSRYSQ